MRQSYICLHCHTSPLYSDTESQQPFFSVKSDSIQAKAANPPFFQANVSPSSIIQTKFSECEKEENVQRVTLSDVGEFIGNVGKGIRETAVGIGEQVGAGLEYVYDQATGLVRSVSGRAREAGEVPRQRPERESASNFCVPYTSRVEVIASKIYLKTVLLPSSASMFGSEVMSIWDQFLSRPSSVRRYYRDGSTIGNGFSACEVIRNRTESLMQLAAARYHLFPSTADNTWQDIPVSSIFTPDELEYPVNFNNPFDIPGHIAGGVSGGILGEDSRVLKGNVSVYREVDDSGTLQRVSLKSNFEFEVQDTVDFCPGDIGAGIEQFLTIPLSRLEASGQAWDVPYQVNFHPTPVEITLSGSDLSTVPGNVTHPEDRRGRGDRTREGIRGLEEKERITDRGSNL